MKDLAESIQPAVVPRSAPGREGLAVIVCRVSLCRSADRTDMAPGSVETMHRAG